MPIANFTGIQTPSGIYVDTTPDEIIIQYWNVSRGNRLGLPFEYTAVFSAPIANSESDIRSYLDIEGSDIDVRDTTLVEIDKAADNMSVTITLNPPEDFIGSISVGIEENILRGTGEPAVLSFVGQTIRSRSFTAGTAIPTLT